MSFRVRENQRGWELRDEMRDVTLLDAAPSLDYIRGYVRGLSDGESMCGPGYSFEEMQEMLDAVFAVEDQWSAHTAAS